MEQKITVDFELVKKLSLETTKDKEGLLQWWEGEPTDLDEVSLAMILAHVLVQRYESLMDQIEEQIGS